MLTDIYTPWDLKIKEERLPMEFMKRQNQAII